MSKTPMSYEAAMRRIMAEAKVGYCVYDKELREALEVACQEHERQAKERRKARAAGRVALCQRPD